MPNIARHYDQNIVLVFGPAVLWVALNPDLDGYAHVPMKQHIELAYNASICHELDEKENPVKQFNLFLHKMKVLRHWM